MVKSIGILDKDYTLWVKELVKRYRGSQIKAAISFYTLYNQQIAIFPQVVEEFYPEKVEGTIPSIKEIEAKLDGQTND